MENMSSHSGCFFSFLALDKSRDGSYLGKILEGFTLAQKDAEEKTVRTLNSFLQARHVFVLSASLTVPSVQLKPVVVQGPQTNKESAAAKQSRSLYL